MASSPGTITVVCKDLPEVKARLETLERQRDVLAETLIDILEGFSMSGGPAETVLAEIESEKNYTNICRGLLTK